MTLAKIHLLTITPLGVLLVYFTNSSCWQFRVLNDGSIYGHSKIYYTAEAAESAGREWVGVDMVEPIEPTHYPVRSPCQKGEKWGYARCLNI